VAINMCLQEHVHEDISALKSQVLYNVKIPKLGRDMDSVNGDLLTACNKKFRKKKPRYGNYLNLRQKRYFQLLRYDSKYFNWRKGCPDMSSTHVFTHKNNPVDKAL
jgi:hypothetical protein